MTERHKGVGSPFDELPDDDDVEWTIVRSLLAANDAASRALEMHLLQARHYSGESADSDSTTRYLDDAIALHEEILEDLQLARDGLEYRQ